MSVRRIVNVSAWWRSQGARHLPRRPRRRPSSSRSPISFRPITPSTSGSPPGPISSPRIPAGGLKFTIYPNGQLVGPPNRQLDAARNGITDMSFVLHGVTPGRYSATELGNLPFTWPKAGIGSAPRGDA